LQFLLAEIDRRGLQRPRIHITECGADRLDEGGAGWVAVWLNSLALTPGYLNIRGWRSCRVQWDIWFKHLGWTFERAYWEMMKYTVQYIWAAPFQGKSRRVECALLFSWWNSGQIGSAEDWSGFRVDGVSI
jgi:hypothetical protein